MVTTDESMNLSFLTQIPARFETSFFDLEAYFPGRVFMKCSHIEPYELTQIQLKELHAKGWEPIDTSQSDQLTLFFRLGSHFSIIIAAMEPGHRDQITFYARSQDIRFAERCDVVLTYELKGKTTSADLEQRMIGMHAIIFDGPNQSEVYRYELKDVGEAGALFWSQIYEASSQGSLLLPNTDRDRQRIAPQRFQDAYAAFYRQQREQMALVSHAAHLLAECYWQLHQTNPKKPVILPKSVVDIPASFRQTKLRDGSVIAATVGLEAALTAISNAVEGARGWKATKNAVVYTHEREQATAAVAIRHLDQEGEIVDKKDISKQLWERVNSYSDLDGDVLLAMLAQLTLVGPDERGGIWITVEDILGHRGIVPKTHETKDFQKREAGHRPIDVKEIAVGITRLRDTHVTIRRLQQPKKTGGRVRKVKQESFLLLISDFLVPEGREETLDAAIAWYYRPGDCLEVPVGQIRKKAAWLLKKALEYDPYHQKWQKRLARYFLFHLRIATGAFGGATITRSIGSMLNDAVLPIDKDDPGRTVARFEHAMHVLQEDGHISSWSEEGYREMMGDRPTRHWLDQWLAHELEISAASLLEDLKDDMIDRLRHTQLQIEQEVL
jgi:hypothetical protein